MKRFNALLMGAALLASTAAMAQTPPANSSGQNNSNAPVEGRNSFTEGQAQSAIEKAGYTNVTGLKKDDNGVWRGKASKGGSSTSVSGDFQGNVIAAK
jgi:opacity protein-like surface antigen